MTVIEAMMTLGVDEKATVAEIKGAANSLLRIMHPDTRGPGPVTEIPLSVITTARDTLLREAEKKAHPCKMCQARGWHPSKYGAIECKQCGGSGVAV